MPRRQKAIIGARKNQSLVILDGFNTAVAALIAYFIDPKCLKYTITSHIGREKGHKLILDTLNLKPMLNLNLALGEAVGSSIVLKILDNINNQFNYDDEDEFEITAMVSDIEDYDDDEFEDDDSDDDDSEFEFNSYNQLFDDEDFDIEFNIYNGAGTDQRYIDEFEDDDFCVEFKKLDDSNISVTDRTFNFYLNTMPILDKQTMQRCQDRIDNLSKPLGSLGLLEELVTQIAGISTESQPSYRLKSTLICFTDKVEETEEFKNCYEEDEDFNLDNPLVELYDASEAFNVSLTVALLTDVKDTSTAFDFGRMTAEDVSFKVPIIGISIANDIKNGEDITVELERLLLTSDRKLKYKADDFLRQIPKSRRNIVGSVIGAIISAAHNSSLVVVDSGAVDLIARYMEQLCPEIRPYILHSDKLFADNEYFHEEFDGECVCIAIEIVRAALYAMANMKTFKETGVDAAIDGIGAIRQQF